MKINRNISTPLIITIILIQLAFSGCSSSYKFIYKHDDFSYSFQMFKLNFNNNKYYLQSKFSISSKKSSEKIHGKFEQQNEYIIIKFPQCTEHINVMFGCNVSDTAIYDTLFFKNDTLFSQSGYKFHYVGNKSTDIITNIKK